MSAITASDVKALRDRTGAGMMACKNALAEADGDIDKAVELLRARGEAQAAKRSGNAAGEGTVQAYIHSNGKIGVLVEIDCETDFVARNEAFVAFAKDLALHIAGAPVAPLAISEDEVPAEDRERELRIAAEQAADRPENVRERIVQGKLDKWLDEVVLLRQEHVKHEGQRIEDLRAKLASDTGENVVIRRFARFAVGE
ncbi:MAG: translation elongation factor Ts [Acidobacteriota bacterium]|nr:translation elongation factor Ts [Acidobacteriota bacterium]